MWWQGIKPTITSWNEAVTSLRSAFGDSRPPHRIYMELFTMSQGPTEKTELFVAKARALLARLPRGDVTEKVQLDMLYGLLHRRVRERLRRDEISSFDMLLRKARHVEDATDQVNDLQDRRRTLVPSSSSPTAGEAPACRSTLPQPQRYAPTTPRETRGLHTSSASGGPDSHTDDDVPERLSTRDDVSALRSTVADGHTPSSRNNNRFCVYCKRYGHLRDECLKLKGKPDDSVTRVVATCYGCNAIGVTRSQCDKCNADYYAVDVAGSTPTSDLSTGQVKHQQVCTLKSTQRSRSIPVPTASLPSVNSFRVHKST